MNIIETNLQFSSLSKRSRTNRIVLHHAAASECGAATIHLWHKGNGWAGIGYHFVVRKNGTIERGRPEHTQGAHASGSNFDSIGICFEGNFDAETMGAAQKNAGIELIQYLKNKYGISKVYGHRDLMATGCPGNKFPFNDLVAGRMNNPYSGWVKDEKGWWYRNANGSYPKSCWLKLDAWYYFDEQGYALSGRWIRYKNKWYYLKSDCRMATGWQKVDGRWYYLKQDTGEMLTGWQEVGGNWYYLSKSSDDLPEGAMATGEMKDGNHMYYLQDSGAMLKGWIKRKGSWYYYNEDNNCQPIGSMMRNHWQGGYYLKDDGKMACNEDMEIGGERFEFGADGRVKK